MYVVGSVLRAIVLEEKLWCLDTIIVAFSRTTTSGPSEISFLGVYERIFLSDLSYDFRSMFGGVSLDYFGQPTFLARVHFGDR